jgi:hypothetical protein
MSPVLFKFESSLKNKDILTGHETKAMEISATFEISLLVGYDAASLDNWILTFRDIISLETSNTNYSVTRRHIRE